MPFALPLQLPSLRWNPKRYRPGGLGYWSGHTPFACDLVALARPSVIVELGVQYGESYFAFCQAIEESGVRCAAYAVDTWRGDRHTGSYGEEVFEEVLAYNRETYGAFSQLLRMSFNEAAERFASESIDLVHIDGVHTYLGAKHDFETWFPRVKPGGVILLHDTQVRSGDFGVWRLWAEVSELYPAFEFTHSCGLGVLFKPGGPTGNRIANIFVGDSAEAAVEDIRLYYQLCAERLEYKYRLETGAKLDQWEMISQVFWRAQAEDFAESRSARVQHSVGTDRCRVRLGIPALPQPPSEIRLDVSDRPLSLCIDGISILDTEGNVVHAVPLPLLREQPHSRGMQFAEGWAGGGIRIDVVDDDPFVILPLDRLALEGLVRGGFIEVVMRVLQGTAGGSLAQAGQRAPKQTPEDCRDAARLARELEASRQLLEARVEQVESYDQALLVAERSIAEREAEISKLTASLADVQVAGAVPACLAATRIQDATPMPRTGPVMVPVSQSAAPLYLDLLKGCLTRLLIPDSCVNEQLVPTGRFDVEARRSGRDWPSEAETMVGWLRLDSLQRCVEEVLRADIPGDLVEAGVWRGGASILMRAVLKAHGDSTRSVWLADSFAGLPVADPAHFPADAGDNLASFNAYLGVSVERVRGNFEKYGLLDHQVHFLEGWFRDTLPAAPIRRIAVLRLDGDMYESTMDILTNLYHRVSPGGFVIVDDYGALANCRAAVDEFRARARIHEPLQPIDWTGVFWRRDPAAEA
jgi:hypothetical protein